MLRLVSGLRVSTPSFTKLAAWQPSWRPAVQLALRGYADVAPEPSPKTSDSPTASPKIQQLADTLGQLTLLEAAQLASVLKVKFGLPDVAVAAAPAAGSAPAAAPAAEPVAEKTAFNVKLMKYAPDKKINVIKVVRAVTNLGLKEAKDLVDGAPKMLKENVTKDVAEDMKKKLEAEGAVVAIE
eukprot:TRINITY_DN301_c0_g1_i1.p1 TRINITY_DN301_c0_g1~~TRINITY_DN301_c0_g1_i1.p1  ORF type:complete len:183 (+),score=44.98 TRINITY_DN301_c0_g1_i1:1-549(+)